VPTLALAERPWRATLGRSLRLLDDFRHEQRDPDRFYAAVAEDSVDHLTSHVPLEGTVVLDVGGGRGYFRDAFEEAGATYVSLDVDRQEIVSAGDRGAGPAVVGDGTHLPVRTGSVDVSYSVNVLEHVPVPWRLTDEMVRVTRPGGTVLISYTLWWGPWGGHETAPWHYLGGELARRRYARRHGHDPKNVWGETLFAVTAGAGLDWARSLEASGVAELVGALPRYHPRWSWWLLGVPVLRELLAWNLVLVLRKR